MIWVSGRRLLSNSYDVSSANAYLEYLEARCFSDATVRAYAFCLLAFFRWLCQASLSYADVTFPLLLEFISSQLRADNPQGKDGVLSIYEPRTRGYSSATINQRLAAISGFYQFHVTAGTVDKNPVPSRIKALWRADAQKKGLLGHLQSRRLKGPVALKTPMKLPKSLQPPEVEALVGSLKTYRDKALASCLLFGGLRSREALALKLEDVDFGLRQLRVFGKGAKERVVPIAGEAISLIHKYILFERPESDYRELFLVSKGPNRGKPLSVEGLRAIFRYHRMLSSVVRGNPHSLRHTYAMNLAEAGVDPRVIRELLGHSSMDSSLAYIRCSPSRVREEYDKAMERQRR